MKTVLMTVIICLTPYIALPVTAPASALGAIAQENQTDLEFDYSEQAEDDALTKLQKEKIRAALEECDCKKRRIADGTAQLSSLIEPRRLLLRAQLDFHNEPGIVFSLLEQQVDFAKTLESAAKTRFQSGVGLPDELARATYFRADAQLKLRRAKAKLDNQK